MLGSVGFGELLFIGLVALIIFGPRRLPEIARRAGDLMAKARSATKEFSDAIENEYESGVAPITDLTNEYTATKDQLSQTAAKLTDMTDLSNLSVPLDASDTDEPATSGSEEEQGLAGSKEEAPIDPDEPEHA